MSQMRVQNAVQLNNVAKAHKKETEELGVQHSTQMSQLRIEMDKVMERAKKMHEIERRVEIEQLNLSFQYRAQEMQVENSVKVKEQIEQINEHHLSMLADAEERSIKEMESKTLEIISLNAQVGELQSSISQFESDAEENRKELEDSTHRVHILELDLDTEKKTAKRDLEKLEEKLNEVRKQEIESLNQRNLEEGQRMLVDFEQGQKYLKNEIKGLKKEYD